MDSAIAELPALPYKDRGGWLTAFGITEILLGAFSLLLGAFTLIGPLLFNPSHAGRMPAGVQIASMVFAAGFYGVIAAFFLVAGIGSLRRRNWARILTLIGSALWLFGGVLGTLFFLFLFPKIMAAQHTVPPAAQHVESIIVGAMVLMAIVFGILLPLTFLIFYSRKSVKATCLAREASHDEAKTPSDRLPFPVIGLVVWEAFGAVSGLFVLVSPVRATYLFGYVVRGWTMLALMLAFSALSAAAAWLIYRKRLAGWNIALLKLLFFGASTCVSFATGSVARLFVEIGQSSGQEHFAQLFPGFFTFIMGTSLILCGAYLVFLIYSRRFFLPVSPSTAS